MFHVVETRALDAESPYGYIPTKWVGYLMIVLFGLSTRKSGLKLVNSVDIHQHADYPQLYIFCKQYDTACGSCLLLLYSLAFSRLSGGQADCGLRTMSCRIPRFPCSESSMLQLRGISYSSRAS